jgi:hypothetical protein
MKYPPQAGSCASFDVWSCSTTSGFLQPQVMQTRNISQTPYLQRRNLLRFPSRLANRVHCPFPNRSCEHEWWGTYSPIGEPKSNHSRHLVQSALYPALTALAYNLFVRFSFSLSALSFSQIARTSCGGIAESIHAVSSTKLRASGNSSTCSSNNLRFKVLIGSVSSILSLQTMQSAMVR